VWKIRIDEVCKITAEGYTSTTKLNPLNLFWLAHFRSAQDRGGDRKNQLYPKPEYATYQQALKCPELSKVAFSELEAREEIDLEAINILLTNVIGGSYEDCDLPQGLRVFDKYCRPGGTIAPDVVTYELVVRGLMAISSRPAVRKATMLYDEMVER